MTAPYYGPGAYGGGRAQFAAGRGLMNIAEILRQNRLNRQDDELRAALDRARQADQYASDLSQPGARTLEEQVQATGVAPSTLAAVGNADVGTVPIRFPTPEARTLRTPGGGKIAYQPGTPRLLPSGAVMDPEAARRQGNLGAIVSALEQQQTLGTKTPRNIDPNSPEGIAAYERKAAIDARYRQPPRPNLPSYSDAVSMIQGRYAKWTPNDPADPQGPGRYSYPAWLTPQVLSQMATQTAQTGIMPDAPTIPQGVGAQMYNLMHGQGMEPAPGTPSGNLPAGQSPTPGPAAAPADSSDLPRARRRAQEIQAQLQGQGLTPQQIQQKVYEQLKSEGFNVLPG